MRPTANKPKNSPVPIPLATPSAPPPFPPVPLNRLRVSASLDYVRLWFPVCLSEAIPEDRSHQWTRLSGDHGWTLTLHDPEPSKLAHFQRALRDHAVLHGFELSVDFWPRHNVLDAERASLLETTYRALAPRFRPEDRLLFGAGMKAAFSSSKPKPFSNRLPDPNEVLVYAHRDQGHQAKLYLKTADQGKPLPPKLHRVRLETTLDRYAGYSHVSPRLGRSFHHLKDLVELGMRPTFAKLFRIIDRPEVRSPSRFSAVDLARLEARMDTAWRRAGVHAFEEPPMPADAFPNAVEAAAMRRRLYRLLPLKDFKLRRDKATNAAIGNALYVLDRRLRRSFSHL